MQKNNIIIHSLWVGEELSALELLTIHSFLEHGHEFNLWVYDDIKTPLPKGVIIRDGNGILKRQKIFLYQHGEASGFGKGSVVGFSEIFRFPTFI